MDELISRQAAIATAISGRVRTLPTTEDGENWIRVSEVRESLMNLPSAQTEPEEFEWCTDCKEYDQEAHCCHRWTKVIRNTVEEIKGAQPEPSVIRCKDCKYFRQHSIEDIKRCGFKHDGMCVFWNSHSTNFEWYCSNGERSDNDEE